jgi:hypothetical protein
VRTALARPGTAYADASHSELSKAAEAFIKQEDEGKYRCKTCQKLFKAVTFVEKHIANKHPEVLKGLDDVRLPVSHSARPQC